MGYFSALAGSGREACRRIPIDPIVSQLRKALQDLSGSPAVLVAPTDEQVLDHLSGHFDPAHAVVLRGLLDTGDHPALGARPELARTIRTRFDALRSDVRDRLRPIQSDLPQRFSAGTLGERLRETGWYRQSLATGAWETTGKGSRKELRAMFLLAYHDLSAELERVLVQCQSRCDHLDDLVSRQCLELEGDGNSARIAMCLAEGLRPGESERRKAWRMRFAHEAEARFCSAMAGHWEKRSAPDLATLHRMAAAPWTDARFDGFTGFAVRYLRFADVLAETMIWFSLGRWNTILSGLPMSDTSSSNQAPVVGESGIAATEPVNPARNP